MRLKFVAGGIVGLVLAGSPLSAREATPPVSADEFSSAVVSDAALGDIHYHLDNVAENKTGPLVVWLPGSGAMPYFQSFADGSKGYLFPRELLAYRDEAHFLLIDKPGLPFEAEIEFDEGRGRPIPLRGPEYDSGLSLANYVDRSAAAIAAAKERLGNRISGVVIIGGSEGGQYTFALALKVRADAAAAWGGLALPQLYDFVIDERLAAERGEITRGQAQDNVQALLKDYQAILDDPANEQKEFLGAPYRRWSTFGTRSVVDDMLALDIPLLLIQGGADKKAPIINTDFAAIAFIANGKRNLDYWVYPEADHSMRVPASEPNGRRVSIAGEVWDRAWLWVLKAINGEAITKTAVR